MRNESCEALIAAATRVFVRLGFAAARMTDIAREAGLSHGLAYHYFANKDAVFLAVVDATMAAANDMAREALDGSEPAVARLHGLCARMLDGARKNPDHSMIMIQASTSAAVPEQAQAVLRRSSDQVSARVTELIKQAQAARDVASGDPAMLARTLLAALSGVAIGAQESGFPSADVIMRLLRPD